MESLSSSGRRWRRGRSRGSTNRAKRLRRARARPRRTWAGRWTASATTTCSKPCNGYAPSPTGWRSRWLSWRSPGCCASRTSPPQSWARAAPSRSRTMPPRPGSNSTTPRCAPSTKRSCRSRPSLGGQETGHVHRGNAGEEAAKHPTRAQTARDAARDVAADLDDDLEGRARGGGEEDDGEEIRGGEAAEPRSEDRGAGRYQRQRRQPSEPEARPALRGRSGDTQSLRDVVDHEADDQEGAECEFAEGEGRPDRESLAEVVDADANRDEQGERGGADGRAVLPAREPSPEEGHREIAQRDSQENQTHPCQGCRQRGLALEGLAERLDPEERKEAGSQGHECGQPPSVCAAERRQPQ